MIAALKSEARKTKIAYVLNAKGAYNIDTAVGFNVLFKEVKETVGSKSTFSNLLHELELEGRISRNRHCIYLREKPTMIILPLLREVTNIVRDGRLKPIKETEIRVGQRVLQKITPESLKDLETVVNLLEVAYEALFHLYPHVPLQHGTHPYVRVVSDQSGLHLSFKKDPSPH